MKTGRSRKEGKYECILGLDAEVVPTSAQVERAGKLWRMRKMLAGYEAGADEMASRTGRLW